ncbi:hypothetical protein Patl1_00168 [Pistacia atlantica]|uniref:Uncharacterized protein n=1 Tax=Pistacia atlantica TaxID=434234 RepID=A0ACC1CCY8_9ROSI|nr:hypothetical protein Patl1_00168 [Pistacia atlantica]
MVDLQTVCCMCGDVGFPDKLFRCIAVTTTANMLSQLRCVIGAKVNKEAPRHGSSSKKSSTAYETGVSNRSDYSGERIKQQDREESADKGKNPSGTPSPRPTTRRYKLLKDVMC